MPDKTLAGYEAFYYAGGQCVAAHGNRALPHGCLSPGQWSYALTIPSSHRDNRNQRPLLYRQPALLDVATPQNRTIVSSNVFGDSITYPHAGNNGWYFRQGQAVQYTPGSVGSIASDTWTVGPGTITFDVTDNGLLTNNFALA